MCVPALLVLALGTACGQDGKAHPDPPQPLPAQSGWWKDRVFYEVFVRSFADSDGDGRGDLRGLTQNLDYLQDGDPATQDDLGVGALWLMPVFRSPSYHGYDVTDYREIDPDYGTLDDLDALVEAAHARGMAVILDLVLNHTSSSHPWFVDSRGGPAAARRAWYHWRDTNPGWTRPWDGGGPTWHAWGGAYYYGVFWSGMPDLNLQNPAVEAELLDVMRFWLARGVDGFRLDAARYLVETDAGQADLPETHALLKRLRRALQLEFPEVLLVGEVWTGAATVARYHGDGDELQLAFGFDVADGIKDAIAAGNAAPLLSALSATGTALAGKDRGFDAPFLSNHDMVRVMRELGGGAAAARLAAAALLALPGTPFLYYGEEVGMAGGAADPDENKRTPMAWGASPPGGGATPTWFTAPEAAGVAVDAQRDDTASLWSLYRTLLSQRAARPELRRGPITFPALSGGGPGAVAFLRGEGAARTLVVLNAGTAPSGPFSVNVPGAPSVLLAEGLTGAPSPAAGGLSFEGLGPRGFALVALD